MPAGDLHLSIHLGPRWTTAAVHFGQQIRPVTFGGHTRTPSGVYIGPNGAPAAGVPGVAAATADPGRYLPDPLAALRVATADAPAAAAVSALLAEVANTASSQAGAPVASLVLTTPHPWGPNSRQRLTNAATAAGLPEPAIITAAAAAAAAGRTDTAGRFVLVCTVTDDYPTLCILDAAGTYPQLAAGTAHHPDTPGITATLAGLITHRTTTTTAAVDAGADVLDWRVLAEIDRARTALGSHPRTPVLLPDHDTPVVIDVADLSKAAQPHLDQLGPAIHRTATDADIAVTDIATTVLVADDGTAPLAAAALTDAGHPPVHVSPDQVAASAAQLTAPAAGAGPTAAMVQLPRTRLTLHSLSSTVTLFGISVAVLLLTIHFADPIQGWSDTRPTGVVMFTDLIALATALAATAATAAAQIGPTTWLSPQGMADTHSTGYLLRRSYLAAAATGLVIAGLWGLGTGVALEYLDPTFLRYALIAAMPVVFCALIVAVISPRIPAHQLATWLPQMRPPLWPTITAAAGALLTATAYNTPYYEGQRPYILAAAAAGAALLGLGTAATIARNRLIRTAIAVLLVPGYAFVVDIRTRHYLVVAYLIALICWHLTAAARTVRAATPADHPVAKVFDI